MASTRYLFEDILENKLSVEPVEANSYAKVKKEWDRVSKISIKPFLFSAQMGSEYIKDTSL